MREIKYKALVIKTRLDNLGPNMQWAGVSEYEEIITVQTIAFNNGKVDLVTDKEGEEYSFFDNSLKAIVQFTGLKGKNGVEIYEGDILGVFDEKPLYVEYIDKYGAFCFMDKFDPYGLETYTGKEISYDAFEIIGNIYENPNLLEGGE